MHILSCYKFFLLTMLHSHDAVQATFPPSPAQVTRTSVAKSCPFSTTCSMCCGAESSSISHFSIYLCDCGIQYYFHHKNGWQIWPQSLSLDVAILIDIRGCLWKAHLAHVTENWRNGRTQAATFYGRLLSGIYLLWWTEGWYMKGEEQ